MKKFILWLEGKRNIIRLISCISFVLIFIFFFRNNYLMFVFSIFLYTFSVVLVVDFGTKNIIDRIILFGMTILSLLCCAGLITEISEFLFHNVNINIYFGITSFFVFGYIYNIVCRERHINNDKQTSIIIAVLSDVTIELDKAIVQSAILIGYLCNIIQIGLLILNVFDNQYNLGIQQYPISEAVVTSLAIEKLIKIHYDKLGIPWIDN